MIETQNPIKWLQLKNNRQLAINPQTGGWLLLDDVCKDIVQKIESGVETEAIFNQSNGISLEDIDKLKYLLHTHNLLTPKTDSTQNKCSSTCALKEYPTLAVLKITLACNLKCVYCYSNAGIDQSSHMSPETAHKVVDEYVRLNPNKSISVVLHGGEPLINFKLIKDLVEYSKKYDNKVIISIQTNASMVTDEIAEFIKNNNIQVGVSLDGPAPFQNTARVLQNGKGSLDQTLRGIRILQKHGVLFGVLGVMTSNVAEHIDEVLDFYLANNIYSFSFIPLMKVGRGGNDSSLYVTGEQIFKAYKRIYERVVENNTHNQEKIHERTLADMASSLFANENTFMCSQIPCGAGKNMLGFSNNGDIYICDDFIGDPDFKIGNVHEAPIDKLLAQSPIIAKTLSRSRDNFKRCKDCVWKRLCGGVCHSVDHYAGKDGELENEVCEFNKMMLPFLIEEFENNPQLPYLLNFNIPNEDPRNIFVALDNGKDKDSIDLQTFYSLMDIHDVKHYEKVAIYGKDFEQNKDVMAMIDILDSKKSHSTVVLESSKLNCPEYKQFIDSNVDEIWIKPDADEKNISVQLGQVKELLQYRIKQNSSSLISILLPIKESLWNEDLAHWIKDNLNPTDKVLLYEDGDANPKSVLEKIRKFNLKTFVIVESYSEETYNQCKDIFMFEKQNIFLIDKSNLKGEKVNLSKVILS